MRFLPISCLIGLILSWQQPARFEKVVYQGKAQGTTYNIVYYTPDNPVSQFQIDSLLNSLDQSLSIYQPHSLISRFNQSAKGIKSDEHLKTVVNKSIETWQRTNGAFDITVQPLVKAWGFGNKPAADIPDDATILELKKCVGSQQLLLRNDSLVKLAPCVTIDVNGIAQGYSVDVLADFLRMHGIRDYMVELGGEIRLQGRRQPGGEKMKIGIESPNEDMEGNHTLQRVMVLEEGAVTTSGSYRKFRESNGKKISHLIDPVTGYPVQNELISVTVYAADAMTADAYDNALMLMGLKKALQYVEQRQDMEAYFIYKTPGGNIADTATRQFYHLLQR